MKAGLLAEPENAALNYFAGLALNLMQRYGEAIPYLDRAAKANPDDIPGRNEQAWAYFATGRGGEAVAIYRRIMEKHPKEITTCMNLALVYERTQKELGQEQWRSCKQIYDSDPAAFRDFHDPIMQGLLRTSAAEP